LALAAAMAALVILGGLYRFLGSGIALDGSGRGILLSRPPDYDALEADRLRQRTAPSPPTAASGDSAGLPGPDLPDTDASPDPEPARAVGGYVPDFRGPARDGRYEEPIRTDWPAEGLALLWKHPIGLGYASFVVADGRAFTIEQRRGQEVVAAYDVVTGRELWTDGWDGEFVEWMGGDGPRATPTYHEGRVFALGALGELRSLDAESGALLWRRNILTDNGASNLEWGMAGAPLILDDKVVVLPGGPNGKSVASYDWKTGEPVWTSLDDRQAYTSPMEVTLAGLRQILIVTATRAVGLGVDDGRLLWEYPWPTNMGINASQPLLTGDDRVFLSSGYGQGAVVFQIRRTAGGFAADTVWESNRMKNKFASSVLLDGHIYGLDEAILACIDAATGELKWKGGRYGYGQLLLAGDHLIVLTEDGGVVLVNASPERHEEIASFPAIEGKTWNYPVVAGGRLLVRNIGEMAAFDIRPR